MNYFDILLLIPLLWGTFKGFKKGLILEAASLVGLFLGIWGGAKFSFISAKYLGEMFEISEKIMPIISFAVTFIIIVLVIFTLAKLFERFIKLIALSFINKTCGAAFGMLKFALIISVVLNLVHTINTKINFIDPKIQEDSFLYKPVLKVSLIIIPGLKKLNFSKVMENSLLKEASSKIEEASKP